MGKLIVHNIMSLDGYVEGPGGDVMALPMDHAFDAYCAERLSTAEVLVLGRTTFHMFERFWPSVADNPEATPTHRLISRRDNEIAKLVISDALTASDTGVWADTTEIVSRNKASSRIGELKASVDADLIVFGSTTTWNALLNEGLVDEVHLMIGSTIVGGGKPVLRKAPKPTMKLRSTRSFEGSDNLLAVYDVR